MTKGSSIPSKNHGRASQDFGNGPVSRETWSPCKLEAAPLASRGRIQRIEQRTVVC
jgi:hypothetical protein